MQHPCPRVELTPSKSRAKLEFRAATSEAQRLRPWYWRPFRRALAALAAGVSLSGRVCHGFGHGRCAQWQRTLAPMTDA